MAWAGECQLPAAEIENVDAYYDRQSAIDEIEDGLVTSEDGVAVREAVLKYWKT